MSSTEREFPFKEIDSSFAVNINNGPNEEKSTKQDHTLIEFPVK